MKNASLLVHVVHVIWDHYANAPDWDAGAPTCAVLEDEHGNPVED